MEIDLVVRNADLATTSDRQRCDIGIRAGRVVALAETLPRAPREIDAAGRLVTPGGVDAHCHLDQPMPAPMRMADGFESGTRSAACGGTTTVVPFAAQARGGSLVEAVADYHARAEGKASIDYAFHLIVSDPTPRVLAEELPRLIGEGYTSFKVYMTYDDLKLSDREILEVLDLARREGAMVMVHAENSDCIAWLTERLVASGRTQPRHHAESRPAAVEREATHRAITFAELVDVPILLVHVSGGEALEQIRWAQSRGLNIYAETCPQYLLLTAASLGAHGFEGAKCVCSPPPRDDASRESVWAGLRQGAFHVVSSDHAPFSYDDPHGKRLGGREVPFPYIPNGIPGLETRLPLLYSEGVAAGRIDIHQFVAYACTNAARLYGLYPRKGTVAVGSDADLVIWDTEREVTITNSRLHHAVDYTPYEGVKVTGWPAITLSRGEIVWADDEFRGHAGHGRFMRCGLPDAARPGRAGSRGSSPMPGGTP
ncbi:MAG TPA: dihydropyrimidinase [Usitatibacter sp.]|nr:dihydropyrimidinase [Usitatibacter sp.]